MYSLAEDYWGHYIKWIWWAGHL